MRTTCKRPSHPMAQCLQAALGDVSKAALIDVIGDAMDLLNDEGGWDTAALLDFVEPRLAARGDRIPGSWRALRPLPRPSAGEVVP